jgi:hypothetical protein
VGVANKAMSQAQVVRLRGLRFFVCEYTGALIGKRYFVPTGKKLRGKEGCFASLPILLRAYSDKGLSTTDFGSLKKRVLEFYDQEDIPVAPELDIAFLPMSDAALTEFHEDVPGQTAWMRVEGAQDVDEVADKKKVKRARVQKLVEEHSAVDDDAPNPLAASVATQPVTPPLSPFRALLGEENCDNPFEPFAPRENLE